MTPNPLFRLALRASAGALVSCSCLVPVLRSDPVDAAVESIMAKRHIPGLSLAVIDKGRIVKARGYGVGDTQTKEPVTADTLFQAGSVSKSVSALGVLKLVEEGKLSLDADVNTELRSWKVPENEFTAVAKVTLRRILSHSAGLTVHGFGGYEAGAPVPTMLQVLDGEAPAHSEPIRVDSQPGLKWRYSGGGYMVMQQLVLDTTGRPFADYMRDEVLVPLGMAASSFEQPPSEATSKLAASGYFNPATPVPGRFHTYPEMAAAGLWTTPSDLARFAISLQKAAGGGPSPVLSCSMVRQMLTRQMEDDGLGVFLQSNGLSARFEHGGRDDGFDTEMIAYVGAGKGAVVMANINDNYGSLTKVVTAIAKAYGWPEYPPFSVPKAIEDKEPEVTARVRKIFEDQAEGKWDRTQYTPELEAAVEKQSGTVVALLKAYGKLQGIALVERRTDGTSKIYGYRLTYENQVVSAHYVTNSAGKVSGLWFQPE